MPESLKVIHQAAFPRTIRLVTTARLREAVLLGLVEEADLAALAEIEGATSNRLLAEVRGAGDVSPYELVHGVPHAHLINASFAYAKPREASRFSGTDRGAWYAGLELETSIAEVKFHMTAFLAQTGVYSAVVEYSEMFASFIGDFLDLRESPAHPCLDPDGAVGYPIGNALARQARSEGLNGIVYPAVRHPGGTCLVALLPHAVQAVAQGEIYRFTWRGSPEPEVNRLKS